MRTKVTPPQLAKEWGLAPEKILTWIKTGQLQAINVATSPGGRPRFLIDRADVAAFELTRTVVTPPTPRSRPRRRKSPDVIEFF
jgi:hypothetical protein